MSLIVSRRESLWGVVFGLTVMVDVVPAMAASISYPDQGPIPPGYTFTDIVESSGTDAVPLYGSPTPVVIGLDFNPTAAFQASSAGGLSDLTDGQLNFTVSAGLAAGGVPFVSLHEGGSYTLGGTGAATTASAGASLNAAVTEINGLPVAPIALSPVSGSVSFGLPGDLGSAPWSLNLTLNIAAQLGPGQVATKVEVVIDNTLQTTSALTGTASIIKTDFDISTGVPEPGTAALIGVACGGLGLARASHRRRQ